MGYFLPERESGAVQRCWAEPVGVGAERQLFITAMEGCTSFPTEKLAGIMPGSPAVSSLMPWTPVRTPRGEKQWACQASGVSGKPEESRSKATEQDTSAAPVISDTCGLRDEPHRNAGTSQNLSCTVHWHLELFLAPQTETPKCHVPRLRPHSGKDPAWETCM